MADFEAVLAAYLKQEASFNELHQALREVLAAAPENADAQRQKLNKLRAERKLPMQDYAKLELQFLQMESKPSGKSTPGRDESERAYWREAAYWEGNWPERLGPALELDGVIENNYRLLQAPPADSGDLLETWEALDIQNEDLKAAERRIALHFFPAPWSRCAQGIKSFVARFETYRHLQHPVLCRVYDCGHSGKRIFVTTERVPENRLDYFIGKYPTGLPVAEVRPIISSLADACDYAVQQGLPELFLRPDNIYYDSVTKNLKVLDFGLDALTEGVRHELKNIDIALTRAYRSCESLAAGGADPRDGTYTLACLTYELLTGQHPFGRKSCPEARDKQFMVTPVKDLPLKQWKILSQGLQLTRKDRVLSPAEFAERMFPPQRAAYWPMAAGVAALLLASGIWWAHSAWQPHQIRNAILGGDGNAVSVLENWSRDKQAAFLQDNDSTLRVALIELYLKSHGDRVFEHLDQFDPRTRQALLGDTQVAARLEEDFRQRIERAAEAGDFERALALLRELAGHYPAQVALDEEEAELHRRKVQYAEQATQDYHNCLSLADTPLHDRTECIFEARTRLARMEPQHALLNDPQLPALYRDEVRKLLDSNAYRGAASLLDDWEKVLPENSPERDSLRRIMERSQLIESHLENDEFQAAEVLLKETRALYPDSDRFSNYEEAMVERKAARLEELTAKYKGYREQGVLLPNESGEDLFEVRAVIMRIDPQHPLLRDEILHAAFFDKTVATAARKGDTLERVRALFATWQELFENPYFQAADQETRERAINRVALRYLLKAAELTSRDQTARARDYLEFAAGLNPPQSVQKKLAAALAELAPPPASQAEPDADAAAEMPAAENDVQTPERRF